MKTFKRGFVARECLQFDSEETDSIVYPTQESPTGFFMDTAHGARQVSTGDFIVTAQDGMRYPVRPQLFATAYQPALELKK